MLLQLMNVGLLYTPVSIYQMTRGALVLFVGMLSVVFLRRRLWLYQSVLNSRFSVCHLIHAQMDCSRDGRGWSVCCWPKRFHDQGF